LRSRLRVVRGDLPVPAAIEDPGIEELELPIELPAPAVFVDETGVRELVLGIHVAPAHPGVRRGRVEIPPVLLRVLAVVPLGSSQPEDSLLQDRIAAVPEGQAQAERLAIVADPGQTILIPAIGARPCVIRS